MKTVGCVDRAIRLIIGVALIIAAINQTIGPWGYLGIILVLTGLFAYCPLYKIFKINTLNICSNDKCNK